MSFTKETWLKVSDFVKTSYMIEIKNITTHTAVRAKADGIEVVELRDSGVVMKIPKRSAALGHILMATIEKKSIDISKKKDNLRTTKMSVTGKITELEALDADSNVISLQFYQFNDIHWKRFLEEYEERQKAVDTITKKIQE